MKTLTYFSPETNVYFDTQSYIEEPEAYAEFDLNYFTYYSFSPEAEFDNYHKIDEVQTIAKFDKNQDHFHIPSFESVA